MVLKEQKRECSNCLTVETRIVSQAESVFIDSPKYFLNWDSKCKNCNTPSYSSLSESYLTEDIEEMKIHETLFEIWRKDDSKSFNPQNDSIEFTNTETHKLIDWIDHKNTTEYKRKILVEVLCYRLEEFITEGLRKEKINFITLELRKRANLVKTNDLIDSYTKKIVLAAIENKP